MPVTSKLFIEMAQLVPELRWHEVRCQSSPGSNTVCKASDNIQTPSPEELVLLSIPAQSEPSPQTLPILYLFLFCLLFLLHLHCGVNK